VILSIVWLTVLAWLPGATSGRAAEPPPEPPRNQPPAKPSYRELQADEELKKNRLKALNMLRKGQFAQEDGGQPVFDEYYKKYALPRWTLAASQTNLTNFRRELVAELKTAKSEPGKANPIYVYLRDKLVLVYMRYLALRPEFHPAVRVNAMLVIGELNESEPAAPAALPKPLPAAVAVLIDAVENPNQLDAVKVAALEGLVRHAQLGGARDPSVITAMLKLVNAATPPEGRTADGHAWIRSLAAEVLGELRWPGNNGEVVKALAKMVAESNSPFIARHAAARALGRLNYQGVAGLNLSEFARVLALLAVDACKAERGQFNRRRLKDHLTAVWFGLTSREWGSDTTVAGIAGLATAPPHQAFVADVRQKLESLLKLFDDVKAKLDDTELEAKINKSCTPLEQAVKK
jgi:hypothetical protein